MVMLPLQKTMKIVNMEKRGEKRALPTIGTFFDETTIHGLRYFSTGSKVGKGIAINLDTY